VTARLGTSAAPLAAAYDAVLLDLDGVVYLGAEPIPVAASVVAAARRAGLRIVFVTNNASRTPEVVAAHLTSMGIPTGSADVVTAAQAVARLLATRLPPKATVLVTGAPALVTAVQGAGFTVVASADERPAGVVSGIDGNLCYAQLAEAALAVRGGAVWLAANLDTTLPSPRGLLPGNGALVAAVAVATGRRPVSAGKPERPLYDEAVRRTGARRPLVVGDRLDTDISGAVAADMDSMLVLTGVATPADLLQAQPPARPTYVAADLGGLLTPHPAPRLAGRVATCGGWSATMAGSTIQLALLAGGDGSRRPEEDRVDGLRAACALAWAASDEGRLPPDLRLAGLPR